MCVRGEGRGWMMREGWGGVGGPIEEDHLANEISSLTRTDVTSCHGVSPSPNPLLSSSSSSLSLFSREARNSLQNSLVSVCEHADINGSVFSSSSSLMFARRKLESRCSEYFNLFLFFSFSPLFLLVLLSFQNVFTFLCYLCDTFLYLQSPSTAKSGSGPQFYNNNLSNRDDPPQESLTTFLPLLPHTD